MRTAIAYLVLIPCLAFAAYAVEPTSRPEEKDEVQKSRQQTQRIEESQAQPGTGLPFPRQLVIGKVTDSSGKAMSNVGVKLFADGELLEASRTSTSGDFELSLPLNVETDQTVIMWFVPSTDMYLMQCVVLKKSDVARQHSLFSRCVAVAELRPQMQVDISLMTEDELLAMVKARGCY